MFRKLFALLCCLLCAAGCALADTTYTVREGVSLELPADFDIVLTPDTPEDDPALARLGLTKTYVDAIFAANSFFLDAMAYTSTGVTRELTLQVKSMPELDTLLTLGDDELADFVEGLRPAFTDQGVTITDYEILRSDELTFVMLYEETAQGYVGIQSVTLHDFTLYSLTLTSYLGALDEGDAPMMRTMLESFSIAP